NRSLVRPPLQFAPALPAFGDQAVPSSFLRIFLYAASCFAVLLQVGCGSDPEPEVKAPSQPAKTKPKTIARKETAQAKNSSAKPATKKGTIATPPRPKESAQKSEAKPEAPLAKQNDAPQTPIEPAPVDRKEPPPKADPKKANKGSVIRESFDQAPDGGLPAGWTQWLSHGGGLQLSTANALSKPNSVICS